jgi:hypothetical protein
MLVITEKVVRLHCMHLTLLRKVLTDVANAAEEREIWQKRRPGSRRRPARCRHGVPIRERESGHLRVCHHVPC